MLVKVRKPEKKLEIFIYSGASPFKGEMSVMDMKDRVVHLKSSVVLWRAER